MVINHLKSVLKIIILGIFSVQMMWAYPGFGKKINPEMNASCNQCHVAFPKLRLYGRTIREIGYNVPVTESEDEGLAKSIYRSIPIGFRGKIDLADTDNGKSMLSLVQILSSGTVLDNKFSWWYHKHLYDTEGDKDSKTIDGDKFVPFNEGQPHEFWFQYNYSTAVNIRFGMFELPFWLSPVKTKIGESEFLCHGATGNPDMAGTLASPQFGLAINGYLAKRASDDDWGEESEENFVEGYNYAFTVTNGKAEFPQGFDFLSDVEGSNITFDTFFGRFTKKNASYAVGVWALTGMSEFTPEDDHGDHRLKTMSTSGDMEESDRYYRLGSHLDLFLKGDDINLYGEIVYGNDINRDWVGGMIDYDHLIQPRILGQVRWSGVSFLNGDAPMVMEDEHGDDHGEEEGGAHAHGAMIMDDASLLAAGIFYLPYYNVRIGLEYVYQLKGDVGIGLDGNDGKGMIQIQFGF